jgi:anti-sigma B factor antagonist
LYKEAAGKGKIRNVCVDMKNMEYISSAGLRVLLIMRKALDSDQNISLVNMNDSVREIIETTGFDTIFC